MKKVVLLTFLVSVTFAVSAQKATVKKTAKPMASAPMMKNLLDSFSYAAGVNVANNMKDQGISKLNIAILQKAMEDVFTNKALALTTENSSGALQRQLEIFAKEKAEVELAKGRAFLEANKKNKDVVVLPSGIQYIVISQNDSISHKPKQYDTVVVNYTGTFIDGIEFDNSYKHGQPGVFPVTSGANGGIIKGWTEILQLMPVGAKWKVFIPSELGWGIAGAGNGAIPPNATTIFEMTLEGIKPGVNPNPAK